MEKAQAKTVCLYEEIYFNLYYFFDLGFVLLGLNFCLVLFDTFKFHKAMCSILSKQ